MTSGGWPLSQFLRPRSSLLKQLKSKCLSRPLFQKLPLMKMGGIESLVKFELREAVFVCVRDMYLWCGNM